MGAVVSASVALNVDAFPGLDLAPFVGLLLGMVNGLVMTLLRVHSFLATIATS